jgi:hypothetical protein
VKTDRLNEFETTESNSEAKEGSSAELRSKKYAKAQQSRADENNSE